MARLVPSSSSMAASTRIGPVEVGTDTKQELLSQAKEWARSLGTVTRTQRSRISMPPEMLQLIVATREYQFG